MNSHRANAGSIVYNDYLYVFGGFLTSSSGQAGVSTWEKLNLKDIEKGWKMCDFGPGSDKMSEKACFYLTDVTDYIRKNSDLA